MWRFVVITSAFLLGTGSGTVFAQNLPLLLNQAGENATLTSSDLDFIQSRMDTLNLDLCRQQALATPPRNDYRFLQVDHQEQSLRLYVQPDVLRSGIIVLISETANATIEYTHCNITAILPVLAIMATADIPDESSSNRTRQVVLASNSFLTSYDSSHLMLRNDSQDSNASYMDFSLSLKHPVTPNAAPLAAFHASVSDVLEQLVPGENEYYLQLYLAFSGRFSQYIGDRISSPVVARAFNPSLFYRFWSSPDNYLDLVYGHESNGQRINTLEGLLREQANFLEVGEPADYAQDSLSRGWDYTAINWQRSWNDKLLTQFKFRHYLDDGLLQGQPEEYKTWENGGTQQRPRRQYDGVSFGFQYNFNRSRCFLGAYSICFQKAELILDTGYSALFENNTTTLELTTDFFGLPIQLWGKTGYNSNLVNYYQHVTSWGLGIELLSH